MVAIRVMKSVAPSENAPLRDIPIRDTLGAPPLLGFKSRSCWRARPFSSCWQKSSHAVAYNRALVRSFNLSCLDDPWQKWTSQCSSFRLWLKQWSRSRWKASLRFCKVFGLWLGFGPNRLRMTWNKVSSRRPLYNIKPSAWFPRAKKECSSLNCPGVQGMLSRRLPRAHVCYKTYIYISHTIFRLNDF